MTPIEWEEAEKKVDESFAGSIYEELGLTDKLCPVCNAHLTKSGICLNACHLGTDGMSKFANMMKIITTFSKPKQ